MTILQVISHTNIMYDLVRWSVLALHAKRTYWSALYVGYATKTR